MGNKSLTGHHRDSLVQLGFWIPACAGMMKPSFLAFIPFGREEASDKFCHLNFEVFNSIWSTGPGSLR